MNKELIISMIPVQDMCWNKRRWNDNALEFFLLDSDFGFPEIGTHYEFTDEELRTIRPRDVVKLQNRVRMDVCCIISSLLGHQEE